MGFFTDQAAPRPDYISREDEEEAKVPRDRWDRPMIAQPDGSKLPYNRASSFGGQIEDKSSISKWQLQQAVRGLAMHPELLNAVPDEAKGDPWAELDRRTKAALTRIADQAQEAAGSNLKSALGTDIHYATEIVDLGGSLERDLQGFEPGRRALLIERGNAYYRVTQDWGLRHDSVEQFIVNDEVQAAGTYDRRSFVPWWPEHRQTTVDVKTSSSLDFAGVGFSVQLSVYAHGVLYDPATEARAPHEDMNLRKALIIHVDRKQDGPVTLAEVDIEWGYRHARLAREIIVARREGRRGKVAELDEREVALLTAASQADLAEMADEIRAWPKHLREKANERWKQFA
jgi:hypothetical protein